MAEVFWHNLKIEEVVRLQRTDLKKGLSEKEVKIRQKKFSKNLLPEEKPLSSLRIFLDQFKSPLIYILVIAGIITLILRDFTDAVIIFAAVFLNTIFGFFQENKTSRILRELKKTVKVKAYVIREGNEKEIDQEDLVPGDIFLLKEGNKVPADGRLVEVHNLKVNESSLTGEWIPAEKKIEILPKEIPLADRDNMVYMGCFVEDGRGKAIATETGLRAEIGKIAQILREAKEEKTPYQKKVIYLSKIIGLLILVSSLSIFIFGVARGKEIFEMFLTAVAVAVAAIPEGLPVAITVILALGMERILRKKGLVRKMIAGETLGSISVIATDKTGTLTEAKMVVDKIYPETNNISALKIAILCSEAFIENPDEPLEKLILRGRPTDRALLMAGLQIGLNKKNLEKSQPKIAEVPFDSVLKYAVSLRRLSEKENILYFLGAPEIILQMSNTIDLDGREEILSSKRREKLQKKIAEWTRKGQRVLATAYKKTIQSTISNQQFLLANLVFIGLIALHDPLRKEAKEAIRICQEARMKVIIVTGDHKLTAKAIAETLGLPAKEENIIEGQDLEKLSDEEFQKKLNDIEIYARVDPSHKMRIIEAWQKRGEIVAMTGDGINDAPALKKADIGVALGSGTDVAKEASDLVLLDNNFSVIVAAIKEGRQIITNIRKVITYLLSDSLTEVILIISSLVVGLPLPVLPGQILWVNLIEDSLPVLALALEPKEKGIMKKRPEDPKKPLFTKEVKVVALAIGISANILLLFLFFFLLGQEISLEKVRTIIFAAFTLSTLFCAFSCKNLRKNIWQINLFSNKILLVSFVWEILMLFLAIYLPFFQKLLKTVSLDLFDWLFLFGLGIGSLILVEIIKWYFIIKKEIEIK